MNLEKQNENAYRMGLFNVKRFLSPGNISSVSKYGKWDQRLIILAW